jgi:flagellar hook-basal body complex protein FliE
MQDFEKLGLFYLGREYDVRAKKTRDHAVLYDSKDLVTHAVCVGMTGSGKTGLCMALVEEAAIDGLPVIAIDPKGDLTNLLLTFPRLAPEDFEPWVNPDEARAKGVSVQEYARQQAESWKKGLADWGEDGQRIQRLRDAAEFAIYTPGSTAGIPVSILKSFAAPPPAIADDPELLGERLKTTVTSLLTLAGLEVDPTRSREHILVSAILGQAWKEGRDLDLAGLVQSVQSPPLTRVGVLDLESFYPAPDRFALAMQLNNLLAAPGFETWLQGEAIDLDRLLYTSSGKPRVCIFSIAHLGDAERMFFVSLLLNQVLGWVRAQSGTSSLRALVYMDEIFGFFPPVANPPSKAPLLTLLKQARAFGVGLVLATQNPVDLDYKGLSNAGTWFLGRLQTERDKARLLDGLEGAVGAAGRAFNRAEMEQLLASLGNRVFLMHNVHEDEPVVFQTRWALSYLRGPLGRDQIRALMAPLKAAAAPAVAPGAGAPASQAAGATASLPSRSSAGETPAPPAAQSLAARPVLPPAIEQYFVPLRSPLPAGAPAHYVPMLYGAARLGFADPKLGIDEMRDLAFLAPVADTAVAVDWQTAQQTDVPPADLEREPGFPDAFYAPLPPPAAKAVSYEKWLKGFSQWLYQSQQLQLLRSAKLSVCSRPDESERDFRIRLQTALREERDRATEQLRQKYAPQMAALTERIRRAEQAVARESEQATHQKLQTAISFGATVLGAFLGRKAVSASTLGRATTAARGVGRTMREAEDVKRATENVDVLKQQLADLDSQLQAETQALAASLDPAQEPLEQVVLKPKKTQISVQLVALVWVPQG